MMTLYVILLIYELYFVIIKDILIFTDLLLLMMNETQEQRVGVLCQLYLDSMVYLGENCTLICIILLHSSCDHRNTLFMVVIYSTTEDI